MPNIAKQNGFYHSAIWRKTRRAYFAHAFGLCERCGNIGKIVHHKIHLNEKNFTDDKILLSFDNLELLCNPCHESEHRGNLGVDKKYYFDAFGEIKKK